MTRWTFKSIGSKPAWKASIPMAVTQMVSNYLTGVVTTQVQSGPKMIGVRAWIPHGLRATQHDLDRSCACARRTATYFR